MNLPDISTMDFTLYFNILFFSILGLGILFGFLRGFKNALYSFIVTVIFFIIFFVTIELVVNWLWTLNMPFLGGLLANIDPRLASAQNLSESLPVLLEIFLGDVLGASVGNENLLVFCTGIALFALKLVYTLLYFTVIQIIYRLVFWIIKMIFFRTKKSERKYRSKNRGLGAVFGLFGAVLSVYVTIIIFGGIMSISESLLVFAPDDQPEQVVFEFPRQDGVFQASRSVIPLDNPTDPLPMLQDAVALLESMVDSYNQNVIVSGASMIESSQGENQSLPLNLYLFDSVLSISYDETTIAIREELSVFASLAG
ncbi:MAG: hypothetical protein WC351_01890, partial [Candidatus Izemoplasmatales bacterium]